MSRPPPNSPLDESPQIIPSHNHAMIPKIQSSTTSSTTNKQPNTSNIQTSPSRAPENPIHPTIPQPTLMSPFYRHKVQQRHFPHPSQDLLSLSPHQHSSVSPNPQRPSKGPTTTQTNIVHSLFYSPLHYATPSFFSRGNDTTPVTSHNTPSHIVRHNKKQMVHGTPDTTNPHATPPLASPFKSHIVNQLPSHPPPHNPPKQTNNAKNHTDIPPNKPQNAHKIPTVLIAQSPAALFQLLQKYQAIYYPNTPLPQHKSRQQSFLQQSSPSTTSTIQTNLTGKKNRYFFGQDDAISHTTTNITNNSVSPQSVITYKYNSLLCTANGPIPIIIKLILKYSPHFYCKMVILLPAVVGKSLKKRKDCCDKVHLTVTIPSILFAIIDKLHHYLQLSYITPPNPSQLILNKKHKKVHRQSKVNLKGSVIVYLDDKFEEFIYILQQCYYYTTATYLLMKFNSLASLLPTKPHSVYKNTTIQRFTVQPTLSVAQNDHNTTQNECLPPTSQISYSTPQNNSQHSTTHEKHHPPVNRTSDSVFPYTFDISDQPDNIITQTDNHQYRQNSSLLTNYTNQNQMSGHHRQSSIGGTMMGAFKHDLSNELPSLLASTRHITHQELSSGPSSTVSALMSSTNNNHQSMIYLQNRNNNNSIHYINSTTIELNNTSTKHRHKYPLYLLLHLLQSNNTSIQTTIHKYIDYNVNFNLFHATNSPTIYKIQSNLMQPKVIPQLHGFLVYLTKHGWKLCLTVLRQRWLMFYQLISQSDYSYTIYPNHTSPKIKENTAQDQSNQMSENTIPKAPEAPRKPGRFDSERTEIDPNQGYIEVWNLPLLLYNTTDYFAPLTTSHISPHFSSTNPSLHKSESICSNGAEISPTFDDYLNADDVLVDINLGSDEVTSNKKSQNTCSSTRITSTTLLLSRDMPQFYSHMNSTCFENPTIENSPSFLPITPFSPLHQLSAKPMLNDISYNPYITNIISQNNHMIPKSYFSSKQSQKTPNPDENKTTETKEYSIYPTENKIIKFNYDALSSRIYFNQLSGLEYDRNLAENPQTKHENHNNQLLHYLDTNRHKIKSKIVIPVVKSIKVPENTNYGNILYCTLCCQKKSFLRSIHSCRVCNDDICTSCSTNLYTLLPLLFQIYYLSHQSIIREDVQPLRPSEGKHQLELSQCDEDSVNNLLNIISYEPKNDITHKFHTSHIVKTTLSQLFTQQASDINNFYILFQSLYSSIYSRLLNPNSSFDPTDWKKNSNSDNSYIIITSDELKLLNSQTPIHCCLKCMWILDSSLSGMLLNPQRELLRTNSDHQEHNDTDKSKPEFHTFAPILSVNQYITTMLHHQYHNYYNYHTLSSTELQNPPTLQQQAMEQFDKFTLLEDEKLNGVVYRDNSVIERGYSAYINSHIHLLPYYSTVSSLLNHLQSLQYNTPNNPATLTNDLRNNDPQDDNNHYILACQLLSLLQLYTSSLHSTQEPTPYTQIYPFVVKLPSKSLNITNNPHLSAFSSTNNTKPMVFGAKSEYERLLWIYFLTNCFPIGIRSIHSKNSNNPHRNILGWKKVSHLHLTLWHNYNPILSQSLTHLFPLYYQHYVLQHNIRDFITILHQNKNGPVINNAPYNDPDDDQTTAIIEDFGHIAQLIAPISSTTQPTMNNCSVNQIQHPNLNNATKSHLLIKYTIFKSFARTRPFLAHSALLYQFPIESYQKLSLSQSINSSTLQMNNLRHLYNHRQYSNQPCDLSTTTPLHELYSIINSLVNDILIFNSHHNSDVITNQSSISLVKLGIYNKWINTQHKSNSSGDNGNQTVKTNHKLQNLLYPFLSHKTTNNNGTNGSKATFINESTPQNPYNITYEWNEIYLFATQYNMLFNLQTHNNDLLINSSQIHPLSVRLCTYDIKYVNSLSISPQHAVNNDYEQLVVKQQHEDQHAQRLTHELQQQQDKQNMLQKIQYDLIGEENDGSDENLDDFHGISTEDKKIEQNIAINSSISSNNQNNPQTSIKMKRRETTLQRITTNQIYPPLRVNTSLAAKHDDTLLTDIFLYADNITQQYNTVVNNSKNPFKLLAKGKNFSENASVSHKDCISHEQLPQPVIQRYNPSSILYTLPFSVIQSNVCLASLYSLNNTHVIQIWTTLLNDIINMLVFNKELNTIIHNSNQTQQQKQSKNNATNTNNPTTNHNDDVGTLIPPFNYQQLYMYLFTNVFNRFFCGIQNLNQTTTIHQEYHYFFRVIDLYISSEFPLLHEYETNGNSVEHLQYTHPALINPIISQINDELGGFTKLYTHSLIGSTVHSKHPNTSTHMNYQPIPHLTTSRLSTYSQHNSVAHVECQHISPAVDPIFDDFPATHPFYTYHLSPAIISHLSTYFNKKYNLYVKNNAVIIKKIEDYFRVQFHSLNHPTASSTNHPAPIQPPIVAIFTDIQSSTKLWEKCNHAMGLSIELHDYLLRFLLFCFYGYEVKTEGDAFFVCFDNVFHALLWCINAQRVLNQIEWPSDLLLIHNAGDKVSLNTESQQNFTIFNGIRVRMGIHMGDDVKPRLNPTTNRMDYFGPLINKTARISDSGHGGQIVCSQEVVQYIAYFLKYFYIPSRAPTTDNIIAWNDIISFDFVEEEINTLLFPNQPRDTEGNNPELTAQDVPTVDDIFSGYLEPNETNKASPDLNNNDVNGPKSTTVLHRIYDYSSLYAKYREATAQFAPPDHILTTFDKLFLPENPLQQPVIQLISSVNELIETLKLYQLPHLYIYKGISSPQKIYEFADHNGLLDYRHGYGFPLLRTDVFESSGDDDVNSENISLEFGKKAHDEHQLSIYHTAPEYTDRSPFDSSLYSHRLSDESLEALYYGDNSHHEDGNVIINPNEHGIIFTNNNIPAELENPSEKMNALFDDLLKRLSVPDNTQLQ